MKKITDVIGISSSFTYGIYAEWHTIVAMTTPYGTTTFASTQSGYDRTLTVTDPNGNQEYFVSDHWDHGLAAEEVPTVPEFNLGGVSYRNTYYFSKKAMQIPGPLNYNNATVYHWFHNSAGQTSWILESEKAPLESRRWYVYPGQQIAGFDTGITLAQPSIVARVVDDPSSPSGYSTQIRRYEYNGQGNLTKYTDPLGRETTLDYYLNGVDLQKVRQTAGSGGSIDETLAEFGVYNGQHQPSTYTSAARQPYALQWNSCGQLTQVTNPKNEVTHLNYDPDGYLQNIQRDWSGGTKTTGFGYDFYGRTRTVTDSDIYVLTYDYDLIDRVTRVTYPDLSFESYQYDRLDLKSARDRLGRYTTMTYDGAGRPLTVKDRLGRVTQFSWCGCEALDSITDPLNHTTAWVRDVRGRVTQKRYEDDKTVEYAYEPLSGRLKSITDAKNQVKNYRYNVDGTLTNVTYTGEQIATPDVSFTYDPNYRRLATMADGTGTTIFTYKPITPSPGTLGAGKLDSVDGPLANDSITHNYDQLGRVIGQSVNGVGESMLFDSLGRLTNHTSSIGEIAHTYAGDTFRIASLTYPYNQSSTFDYFENAGDRRLKQIWNKKLGGATVSKFDYQYDVLGRITQWAQQADAATPQVMSLDCDLEDQLLNASISPQGQSTIAKAFSFGYDPAGNRTREQIETTGAGASFSATASAYNDVNQLTGRELGPVTFRGKVNEPATVTLQANGGAVQEAKMTQDSESLSNGKIFSASLSLPTGVNTVQIVATDFGNNGNGNLTTNKYSLTVNSVESRSYSWDANGNCTGYTTANGSVSYEWDAEDRLVKITQQSTGNPTLTSEFTYDGFGRRVKIVEKSDGSVTSTKQFVWSGMRACEERDENNTVTKRFFDEGMQVVGTPYSYTYYYTRDHLGSIRELVDGSGAVRARYDYDPYGRRTKLFGNPDADFGFTGHYVHAPSGLHLALYRAYDADIGRWLNRDPIEEEGGLNLYAYVRNSPVNLVDPLGWRDWGRTLACVGDVTLNTVNPIPLPFDINLLQGSAYGDSLIDNAIWDDLDFAGEMNEEWEKHKYNSMGGDAKIQELEKQLEQAKRGPRSIKRISKDVSALKAAKKSVRKAGWLGKLFSLPSIFDDLRDCWKKGKGKGCPTGSQ